tara:strand:+ start:142 stop:354 length:213 start_codon:yes stop_codon:yes gene_type:complete
MEKRGEGVPTFPPLPTNKHPHPTTNKQIRRGEEERGTEARAKSEKVHKKNYKSANAHKKKSVFYWGVQCV